MQFTKQYLTEDIDDFSDSIFDDEPLDEVNDEQVNEDNRSLLPLIKTILNNIKGLRVNDAWEDEDDKYLITIPMVPGSSFGDIREKAAKRLKASRLSGRIEIVQDLLILHINN